jgi:hypothetical protein
MTLGGASLWMQLKEPREMFTADLVFAAGLLFMIVCNFYYGSCIRGERVAMQWGFDGKPTWYAPKRWALWGMVGFMLAVRLLIWLLATYTPERVHGVETGILGISIIIPISHAVVLRAAARAA